VTWQMACHALTN